MSADPDLRLRETWSQVARFNALGLHGNALGSFNGQRRPKGHRPIRNERESGFDGNRGEAGLPLSPKANTSGDEVLAVEIAMGQLLTALAYQQ